jgi:hypothetical protein
VPTQCVKGARLSSWASVTGTVPTQCVKGARPIGQEHYAIFGPDLVIIDAKFNFSG